MAHLPVFLALRGPVIKPTVSQDFVPGKGEWPPTPHSFVPGWEVYAVCSLLLAAPSAVFSTLMRGMRVGWGVVRCNLPEPSASPTPG